MTDKKLEECLAGREETKYLLPFFWQHGEEHSVLEREIDAIYSCGIREFCVESRPHPDFCGEGWWDDLGFIISCAGKRGMRVWILDDVRFPSGVANFYLKDCPERQKTALKCHYVDYPGPCENAAVIAPDPENGKFLAILAYRRTENGNILEDEYIDLTGCEKDGILRMTLPAGVWRVYYIMSGKYSKQWMECYVDMLDPESCRAMIDGVYQPHYEHFGEYFGSTIAGFFSDEPNFSNDSGDFHSTFGKEGMLFPWRDDLPERISAGSGLDRERVISLLPAFWHGIKSRDVPALRTAYMDAVTKAVRENFSFQLGNWCREHGVMYIGHVIEDMETHMRLGLGLGHFFRALDGQDMAGCDVVIQQIMPGLADIDHTSQLFGGRADPEFFDYALGKLASSHAHIDSLKKHRAICEIFGAFGWAEGVPMMKWMADHMLADGINYFVPHAFSPKYPDPDCPPHFFAGGTNPQFRLFGQLCRYMIRCCHLLSEGTHIPCAAVYYNAEAEWSGGKYDFFRKTVKTLTQAQLDSDIIPFDYLDNAEVRDGKLTVNGESYPALVVPYSEILPEDRIKCFSRLAENGLPVIFTKELPESTAEGGRVHLPESIMTAEYEQLPDLLEALGCRDITFSRRLPYVRYHHLRRGENDVLFLFNNNVNESAEFTLKAGFITGGCFFDAYENRIFMPEYKDGALRVVIPKGGAVIWVSGTSADEPFDYGDGERETLSCAFTLSVKDAVGDGFRTVGETVLHDLSEEPEFSHFCGTLRYEGTFAAAEKLPRAVEFPDAGETAEVWLNGKYLGSRISAPYRFDLTDAVIPGENKLTVETITNPAYRNRDDRSSYLILPVMGLTEAEFIYEE